MEETPDPVAKAIEANTNAELELTKENPDISLAQAWASVSANWFSMVDPRGPEVRKLMRARRQA